MTIECMFMSILMVTCMKLSAMCYIQPRLQLWIVGQWSFEYDLNTISKSN